MELLSDAEVSPLRPQVRSLSLAAVRVRYRGFELTASDLEFGPGVTLLAGPNGAGKTTLLKALAGTIRTRSGAITLGDAPLKTGDVGMLPQRPSLPRDLTPQQVVEYVLWLRGASSREARTRAAELLGEFHLDSHADRPTRALSGGMARRLSICCTVAASPPVVLLDEPTNDLDPIQRRSVLEMIATLGTGRIVIVSSHALTEISGIADHVVLMNHGRAIFDGDLHSLREEYGPQGEGGVESLYVRAIVANEDSAR
ncbi:ABC transporter ATP-binding protein [Brachybacterium timonense]|uniref:ABC transporter ATP-binding protein n=1 Tax=Brachybacterium timonense TaxID=2050896 RepID=UPI0031845B56